MFPRTGVQEQVRKRGYQARVPKQSSQEQICKQGVQAQVSKQNFCCSRQMVNKRFISVYLRQLSIIIPTNFCWLFHVVVAVGDIFWVYFWTVILLYCFTVLLYTSCIFVCSAFFLRLFPLHACLHSNLVPSGCNAAWYFPVLVKSFQSHRPR